jgi:hypothetical protein
VLVNIMLEISRQGGIICVLHLRRKAVLGLSQVFRSYYLRAP